MSGLTSLSIQPYDLQVWEPKDADHVHVHIWGHNPQSEPCLFIVNNFPAYFYAQLEPLVNTGDYINPQWVSFEWSLASATDVCSSIDWYMKRNPPADFSPFKKSYIEMPLLQGYRGKKPNGDDLTYPMLKLQFKTIAAMKECADQLRKGVKVRGIGGVKFQIHEDRIDVIRKFTSTRNIRYADWFTCQGYIPEDRVSTAKHEYVIDWTTVTALAPEQAAKLIIRPSLLSVDIEVYSHQHRAMPDRRNDQDVCYMISCVYQRYKDPSTRQSFLIIIGDCNEIPPERLDNCTVYTIADGLDAEVDLVNAFAGVVLRTDPDCLVGYNILAFDYPYLNHRVARKKKPFPVMGRLIDVPSTIKSMNWNSGAYGYVTINNIIMYGRLTAGDMLTVLRKNKKLDRYDLNSVCEQFLGRGKYPISAERMFEIYDNTRQATRARMALDQLEKASPEVKNYRTYQPYKEALERLHRTAVERTTDVAAYCVNDSLLVIELMEYFDSWTSLIAMSSVVGVTVNDVITRGQQIRCVSQIYHLCNVRGIVMNNSTLGGYRYSGGAVADPIKGLSDCAICLDFSSLYPSIIIAYNICYTTLVPADCYDSVPDSECNVVPFTQIEKLSDQPVVARGSDDPDSEGYVHDAFVDDEDKEVELDPELQAVKEAQKAKGTIEKSYVFKFYRGKVGILPTLLKNLIAERRAVQGRMEAAENQVTKDILNAQELAIKVAANSIYGFLGVQEGGMLPLLPAAMCVTALGRKHIGEVAAHIRTNHNGTIVYGDTDSVMVITDVKDPVLAYRQGRQIAMEISGARKTVFDENGKKIGGDLDWDGQPITQDRQPMFSWDLKLALEAVRRLFCLEKKKYLALTYDTAGNLKKQPIIKNGKIVGYKDRYALYTRGVLTARRDNIQLAKDLYDFISYGILVGKSYLELMTYLVDTLVELFAGRIDYKKFVSTRALGGNYKSNSYFMKVFADRLASQGVIVNAGERLPFVVVKSHETKLGHRMRLLEKYEERRGSPIEEALDIDYYLLHVINNPINQLFKVAFPREIWMIGDLINCRPSYQSNWIYLDKPVLLLTKMREQGVDISQIPLAIAENLAAVEEGLKHRAILEASRPIQLVLDGVPTCELELALDD